MLALLRVADDERVSGGEIDVDQSTDLDVSSGSVTIQNMPVGKYTIAEVSESSVTKNISGRNVTFGWSVTGEGEYEVTANTAASVTITNVYTAPDVAPTDFSQNSKPFILLAVFASALTLLTFRRKQDGNFAKGDGNG